MGLWLCREQLVVRMMIHHEVKCTYNKLMVRVGLKPGNIQRNTVPERTIQRSSAEELKDMSEELSGVMSNRVTIKEFN